MPLLDHRVVEALRAVPDQARFQPLGKKALLKRLAMPELDPEIFDRPKAGFAIPVGEWLRGPLREWAESLLTETSLREGLLEPGPVRRAWAQHVAGRANMEPALWTVLMWQAWRRRW